MDFTKAAMLIGAVYAITEWLKANVDFPARISGLVAMVVAIGTVFLAASTAWAHTQVIGDVALDRLNVASKLFAGILIGASASVLHATFDAARNIGQNQGD